MSLFEYADLHPNINWIEVTRPNGKRIGYKIIRGKGLEMTIEVYKL